MSFANHTKKDELSEYQKSTLEKFKEISGPLLTRGSQVVSFLFFGAFNILGFIWINSLWLLSRLYHNGGSNDHSTNAVSQSGSSHTSAITPFNAVQRSLQTYLSPIVNGVVSLIRRDQPRWKCKITAAYVNQTEQDVEDSVIFEFDTKEEAQQYANRWIQTRYTHNREVTYNVLIYKEGDEMPTPKPTIMQGETANAPLTETEGIEASRVDEIKDDDD